MKVAVFGATGGIGKHVVGHALDRGYEARAFVRNPAKLKIEHPALEVVAGQVDDYDAVRGCIEGCDAVVNALGISMKPKADNSSVIEAQGHILHAMEELGVRRYVGWSTPSVHSDEDARSFVTVVPGVLAGLFLPGAKKALLEVDSMVRTSDTDWTVVRFMSPTNNPPVAKMEVGFGDVKMNMQVPRESIAAFMVDQLESDEYVHRMPIIGS